MILAIALFAILLDHGLTVNGEERIGCFGDYDNDRAFADYTNVGSVQECRDYAIRQGSRIFGVQNGNECWVKDQGYSKHGVAVGCTDGKGGQWKNDVYKLVLSYKGCFFQYTLDPLNTVLSVLKFIEKDPAVTSSPVEYNRDEVLEKCKAYALKNGAAGIALQSLMPKPTLFDPLSTKTAKLRKCFLIMSAKNNNYKKYGSPLLGVGCDTKYHLGGLNINDVYLFN